MKGRAFRQPGHLIRFWKWVTAGLLASGALTAGTIESAGFRMSFDDSGVSGLAEQSDFYQAEVVPSPGRPYHAPLATEIFYQSGGGDWKTVPIRVGKPLFEAGIKSVVYQSADGEPLLVKETYRLVGNAMEWTMDLTAREDLRVGDLSVTVPAAPPRGEAPKQIFEHGFISHPFISGDASFVYYTRASGAAPHLLFSTLPGTPLEYFEKHDGALKMFVHSARSGAMETAGTWRQAHTDLSLKAGENRRYGFRFEFAADHDGIRELLFKNGLFDIRVVPGMTLPRDLSAKFSLRTRAKLEAIEAEYPDQTTLRYLGESLPDHHLYEVSFRKLGENMLTIRHGEGRRTRLEFFSCEPMETLIKKRARFLVEKTLIRDPTKWWNGAFGPYDMKAGVTRTIDDPDIFRNRMIYALTCDDPGLCKAPYVAAKNVHWPDQQEIEALEYHLEHFVWGKLQRTDDEIPYPYGVYGTPHWHAARDEAARRKRAETETDPQIKADLKKMRVFRSYDYPHLIMLYFHLYQIAKTHPEMSKYLDAAGYLERAWGTARAFFMYPYELYPSYYETYKWGLYNELLVLDLIEVLEHEGFADRAQWLRAEWEKKVKYFVYDDEYPLRSEYAFDRTAFESSHAFAKYGATRDMAADKHLWWDWKQKKWYSHPLVRREDSRAFMDRQIAGNLAVRGWVNPAYYRLGSDPGVSYMAAMGGWSVLDYGLNFAGDPYGWLQLGYASYLSSWCLMNSGDAESGYGAWFPGKGNDGAAGWQFESSRTGKAWMASEAPEHSLVPRGPWRYDGEIDLGFGGALRMAQTLVTDDPLFGWTAYGGQLSEQDGILRVIPRDGLGKRFNMVRRDPRSPTQFLRFKLQLSRDGFSKDAPIEAAKDMSRFRFTIDTRGAGGFPGDLMLDLPYGATFTVTLNGRELSMEPSGNWDHPWRVSLPIEAGELEIKKVSP
jgi:hypothetical protein